MNSDHECAMVYNVKWSRDVCEMDHECEIAMNVKWTMNVKLP